MPDQVITVLSAGDFLSTVSSNLDVMAGIFSRYFSGADNLRIVSIILMLLAFILFLFLIIILYVKSIVSFLKSDQAAQNRGSILFDDSSTPEGDDSIASELELEKELEKELERELEQARAEKQQLDEHENQRRLNEEQERETALDEEKDRQKKEKYDRDLEKAAIRTNERIKTSGIDLDWKKGKLSELEANRVRLDIESLQYQQSRKGLSELLGLIIDMAGRGVDDLKIAQSVMFRNQGQNTEDDILQVIEAIEDFIALCVNGKFEQIRAATDNPLPREDEALFHLSKGDPSLALALIEALMDAEIDRGASMSQGDKRDMLFREVSNYACTFGTLASLSDVHLATGAFELAIELAPQNVNAWSRAADMYARAESNNKAVWAYENVLNLADEEIYPRQGAFRSFTMRRAIACRQPNFIIVPSSITIPSALTAVWIKRKSRLSKSSNPAKTRIWNLPLPKFSRTGNFVSTATLKFFPLLSFLSLSCSLSFCHVQACFFLYVIIGVVFLLSLSEFFHHIIKVTDNTN